MIPYKNPSSRFEAFGPDTAMTPKVVAHGGGEVGATRMILKGNPVGFMQHEDGRFYPYFSARMEHSHEPVEHAMLSAIDVDHYGLGTVMPRKVQEPPRQTIKPSANGMFAWPDTSVSSPFRPHFFGGLQHPGEEGKDRDVVAGQSYGTRKPETRRAGR